MSSSPPLINNDLKIAEIKGIWVLFVIYTYFLRPSGKSLSVFHFLDSELRLTISLRHENEAWKYSFYIFFVRTKKL